MTGAERGLLLLTSHLGQYRRKPLTMAGYRNLCRRMQVSAKPELPDRELTRQDLLELELDGETADRILHLLSEEQVLDAYLEAGRKRDCEPLTRVSAEYPQRIRWALGNEAPGCLWLKGDPSLLSTPMVALVGSRELHPENQAFAREVGRQAALQGFTLLSGNARGADLVAQESCLDHGGNVVSVIPDKLEKQPLRRRVLYISEDSFDLSFSSIRALSRNRLVHSMGLVTYVAQCNGRQGGTWSGTEKNLQNGWTPVRVFDDGSHSCRDLEALGAVTVTIDRLGNLLSTE